MSDPQNLSLPILMKLVRPELVPKLVQWRILTGDILEALGPIDLASLYSTVLVLTPAEPLQPGSSQPESSQQESRSGRPSIVEALKVVLGDVAMDLDAILTALRERDWEPATTNPRNFVITVLTDNKPLFESEGGRYRVAKNPPVVEGKVNSSLDHQILQFLAGAPKLLRSAHIAAAVHASPVQVRVTLTRLHEKGLVRGQSGNRQLLWGKK